MLWTFWDLLEVCVRNKSGSMFAVNLSCLRHLTTIAGCYRLRIIQRKRPFNSSRDFFRNPIILRFSVHLKSKLSTHLCEREGRLKNIAVYQLACVKYGPINSWKSNYKTIRNSQSFNNSYKQLWALIHYWIILNYVLNSGASSSTSLPAENTWSSMRISSNTVTTPHAAILSVW